MGRTAPVRPRTPDAEPSGVADLAGVGLSAFRHRMR